MTYKYKQDANHARGCIIHCHDPENGETIYWFRVYDYNNLDADGDISFVDYRIIHNDLFVKIDDEDAAFFEMNGEHYLDHMPIVVETD